MAAYVECKDIPDQIFLAAVDRVNEIRWGGPQSGIGASVWDISAVLAGFPERVTSGEVFEDDQVPTRLVRAKGRKLVRRGLLSGCWCGCRGDFQREAS